MLSTFSFSIFLELQNLDMLYEQRSRVKLPEKQIHRQIKPVDENELALNNKPKHIDQINNFSYNFSPENNENSQNNDQTNEDDENEEIIPEKIYTTTAVKFNNNQLINVTELFSNLGIILRHPNWLNWLDLSFNRIKILGDFSNFPQLKILYLHGNLIDNFEEVMKLKTIEKSLKQLTLHGNQIETEAESGKVYRQKVLRFFPVISNLDFSRVTNQEKVEIGLAKSKGRPLPV